MIPHQEEGSGKPLADAARQVFQVWYRAPGAFQDSLVGEYEDERHALRLASRYRLGRMVSVTLEGRRPEAKPAEGTEAEPKAPAPVEDGKRGAGANPGFFIARDCGDEGWGLSQIGPGSVKPGEKRVELVRKDAFDPMVASLESMRKALAGLLGAQDATKAYMRAIPDGMLPEQNHLGRLLNAEEKAEAAARAALAEAGGA